MDKKKRIEKIVEMRTRVLQEQWYKDLADYYDVLPDITKAWPRALRVGLRGALALPAMLLSTDDVQAATIYDPETGESSKPGDDVRMYTFPHGPWEVFNDLKKAKENQKSESYVNFRNKLLQEEARIDEQIGLFKINPDKLDPRTLETLQNYDPDINLNARRGSADFRKIKNLEKMFRLQDKGYTTATLGDLADMNIFQKLFAPKTKHKRTKGPGYNYSIWIKDKKED